MARRSYPPNPLLSAVAGCALLAWGGGAAAGEREIYERTVSLVQDRYLDLDTLQPVEAFLEAAEAAEDAVPWLIADVEGETVTLRHGERGVFAVLTLDVGGDAALAALPGALERLEDAVRLGGEVPADLDLPIELLRGFTRALDRHSVVLARNRLERFNERIKGKLSGIGARITLEAGKLHIAEVFSGGPAEIGGLRPGDAIEEVDGISTLGMTIDQAVGRIRGPEGTQVVLTLQRPAPGGPERVEIVLTRDEVVIPNVRWSVTDAGIGLVEIDHFSEQTAPLLVEALLSFEGREEPVKGVILDLRGNSGGSMIQACRSVDQFVDDGVILRTEGRGGERVSNLLREYSAQPGDGAPHLPVVLLVNRRSASASEILAGALKLLDRAVLVGVQTHGKGTVQKLYTLRGGGPDQRARLKLTVARYLLPFDTPIETREGLLPDVQARPIRFDEHGVRLRRPGTDDPLSVQWVDERPGWRPDGSSPPEQGQDFGVELAESILLTTESAHRSDLLQAAQRAVAVARKRQDQDLVEAFRRRGIDWQSADEAGPAPEVEVEIRTTEAARAGAPVEVVARVTNTGGAPLYRLRVHLRAPHRDLPWHGLVLPVGFLPPGEVGEATATAHVATDLPSRQDPVTVTVAADARPPVDLEPVTLAVQRRSPPLSVSVRLQPSEEGRHRAEVQVRNLGTQNLVDVRAGFALPEDTRVELLDREAVTPYLRAGADHRFDLSVHLLDAEPEPVELELRVASAVFGRMLRVPLVLSPDGSTVELQPPRLSGELPLVTDAGRLRARVEAVNDQRVASVTAWLDRQKIAWRAGQGRRQRLDLDLDLEPGSHSLVVRAEDNAGSVTRQEWVIRVRDPAAAPTP